MTDDDAIAVDELADYCRTQARLLRGTAETLGEEVTALLDELDERAAEVRDGLETGAASPDAVDELETRQAEAEAKRARMESYQDLAAEYAELAESLTAEEDDGSEALERVVQFEVERDAPAYFDEVETIAERVAVDGKSDRD